MTILKKRTLSDMRTILKMPQGRRILWQILQAAQIRQHGFIPGDSLATAFHCGQRSIGLFLLENIEQAAPGAYQQMRGEYTAEMMSMQNQLQQESEHE